MTKNGKEYSSQRTKNRVINKNLTKPEGKHKIHFKWNKIKKKTFKRSKKSVVQEVQNQGKTQIVVQNCFLRPKVLKKETQGDNKKISA